MIWILYGQEEYLRTRRRQALIDELLRDLPRDFALEVIRGRAFTAARLMNLYEMAFGSPYKVVLLLEAEAIPKADLKALETYLQQPSPVNHLIIEFGTEQVPKLPKGEMQYEAFHPLKPKEALAWLEAEAQALGLTLPPESVTLLVETLGTDLRLLRQTLETLAVAGISLEPQTLTEAIGLHPQYNLFRLIDALAERDHKRIWLLMSHFAEDPRNFPTAQILWHLQQFFYQLGQLRLAYGTKMPTAEAIQGRLGLRYGFQARPYLTAYKRYSLENCSEALTALRQVDAQLKGVLPRKAPERVLVLSLAEALVGKKAPLL